MAAICGQLEILKFLIEKERLGKSSEKDHTLLFLASKHGKVDKHLLISHYMNLRKPIHVKASERILPLGSIFRAFNLFQRFLGLAPRYNM